MITFDLEPKQILLNGLYVGVQIVSSINIEKLINLVALEGQEKAAIVLGNQLIDLLKTEGSLIKTIDFDNHIIDVVKNIDNELKQKEYEENQDE